MQNKHKLEFVNQNKEFELPKISVKDEIDVLDYLTENTKENDSENKKRYMEYAYATYKVLNKVDKNVKYDQITENFSLEELMVWYFRIRARGNKLYSCPHCKEKLSFWNIIEVKGAGDAENFQKADSTKKKEKTG